MVEKKERQHVSDNAQLMAEWNFEKNSELGYDPNQMLIHSNKRVWWRCLKGHEWQTIISNRTNGRGCPYCSGRYAILGKTDLRTINPTLADSWNYEKNADLKPEDFTVSSGKKAWWKCEKGHEWKAAISDRNNGNGCPYCSNKKVWVGYNDLKTVNPTLAQDWNYERNDKFKPENFTANSGKKVWWKCAQGHEWQATIDSRNHAHGCPYCSGLHAITGENDLLTINPYLIKEWNYEKNNGINPEHLKGNSNKRVWWKCEKGHEWQAVIHTRNKGVGCPICKSERNTSFPEYVIFYYLREYGLEPIHSYKVYGYELDIYIPSKKIAIEYDGYYWHKNKIKKELDKNKKCQNDGITLYRIREELPSLNDTSIDYVVRKDQKNLPDVLKTIIHEITGESVEIDIDRDYIYIENIREYAEKSNSILVSNPKLVKEWNYEKNGNLKPQNITSNSSKKVWWKCEKGHEWQARVDSRTCGNNCPYCSGRYAIVGKTDLRTINPTLAQDWNYEKNANLNPENFTPNSGKKVWWRCVQGHEWQATIDSRNRGNGCPECARIRRKKQK